MTDVLLGLSLLFAPDPVAPAPINVVTQQSAEVPKKVLSLSEALSIGEKRAFSIAIAETVRSRTRSQIDQARGGLLPRVTGTGSYTRFDPRQPGFNGPGIQDTRSLGLGLSWVVDLSGAISNGVRAAYFALQAAEFNKSNAAVDTRHSIRTAYFGAVQAIWNVKANESALASSEERLRIAKQRVEVGAAPQFDVIRLEAERSGILLSLTSAQNTVLLAKQALNNAMAVPIETEFDLETEPAPVGEVPDATTAVQTALKTRPDLKALDQTVRSLAEVKKAESKGQIPTVSLSSNFSHTFNPGPFARKDQTTTTLGVSWPIFDGGITRARTKTAEQNLKQAELQLQQVQLAASLQVQTALVQLQTAQQQVQTAEQQVKSAEEAYRIANLLFENGRGILIDVLTANENLLRARTSLNNARFQVQTAFADLQRAMGTDQVNPSQGDKK